MRTCLLLALAVLSLSVRAGGLERIAQVDLIELEPQTARAHMVVLLDEDRVNTRQAVKALFKKVNNYLDFVESGQIKAAAPNASTSLPPRIVVYGPKDASSGEMQNLDGLKLAGKKAGVEVLVKAYEPGIKARPIPINPTPKTSRH